jgi:hypothetical protein
MAQQAQRAHHSRCARLGSVRQPTPDQRGCRPQMIVLPTVLLGGTHFGMQPSAGGSDGNLMARRALCDELPRALMGWDYLRNFSAFNGKAAVLRFWFLIESAHTSHRHRAPSAILALPVELPRSGRSAHFRARPSGDSSPARSTTDRQH